MKVLELFCGVGSFSISLDSLGIKHDIVGFSDIRETAIDLFCKIHNKDKSENLGDIKNVNAAELNVDLLVFGSPCQSFTRQGKMEGGTKGSDTKSALMWEAVRIMEECKPKWIIWENVPDAVNKLHIDNFKEYMVTLDELGYNTYYKVINAHEIGSPQKRKRLFAVSIRKDIDNGEFNLDYEVVKPRKMKDYLDVNVPSHFGVEEHVQEKLLLGEQGNQYIIKNGTKLGYLLADEGDAIDWTFPTSKTRRGRVQKEACQTLLRSKGVGVIQDGTPRYLTPHEFWKLQEMPLELYKFVEECDFKLKDQYDVVGGVINQLHLKVVLGNLAKAFNW